MSNFKQAFLNCCAADASQARTGMLRLNLTGKEAKLKSRYQSFNYRDTFNADFDTANNYVSVAEGGYTANPADKGNWSGGAINSGVLAGTNFGISAPTLKAYLGREITADDMQNLSYDTAVSIYKKNYWTPIKGDSINSQDVANIIFDESVNSGVGAAQKTVKDSLGISTYDINAINAADPTTLFNQIGALRTTAYTNIGGQFLNSWLNRLKNLGYTGLANVQAGLAKAKANPKTTIAIILGFILLITGIIILVKEEK